MAKRKSYEKEKMNQTSHKRIKISLGFTPMLTKELVNYKKSYKLYFTIDFVFFYPNESIIFDWIF